MLENNFIRSHELVSSQRNRNGVSHLNLKVSKEGISGHVSWVTQVGAIWEAERDERRWGVGKKRAVFSLT